MVSGLGNGENERGSNQNTIIFNNAHVFLEFSLLLTNDGRSRVVRRSNHLSASLNGFSFLLSSSFLLSIIIIFSLSLSPKNITYPSASQNPTWPPRAPAPAHKKFERCLVDPPLHQPFRNPRIRDLSSGEEGEERSEADSLSSNPARLLEGVVVHSASAALEGADSARQIPKEVLFLGVEEQGRLDRPWGVDSVEVEPSDNRNNHKRAASASAAAAARSDNLKEEEEDRYLVVEAPHRWVGVPLCSVGVLKAEVGDSGWPVSFSAGAAAAAPLEPIPR